MRPLKYITGTIWNNVVIPMGYSKTKKFAKEVAKRHDHRLFVIIEEKEYKKLKAAFGKEKK